MAEEKRTPQVDSLEKTIRDLDEQNQKTCEHALLYDYVAVPVLRLLHFLRKLFRP